MNDGSTIAAMSGELSTTNLFLGTMAAVSVLEALLIMGLGVVGIRAYRQVIGIVQRIEAQQVAPTVARVNAILDDVKTVTATVQGETERVDRAFHAALDRVDDTADRMRSHVRAQSGVVVGFVRGLRAAIGQLLNTRHQSHRT